MWQRARCAGGVAIKGGLPVDNQHACEVRTHAAGMPRPLRCAWAAALASLCLGRSSRTTATPAPSHLPLAWPAQYFLVKDDSVDVEELLASLAPKLPVSLDGGV